jgi:hypothetical protein
MVHLGPVQPPSDGPHEHVSRGDVQHGAALAETSAPQIVAVPTVANQPNPGVPFGAQEGLGDTGALETGTMVSVGPSKQGSFQPASLNAVAARAVALADATTNSASPDAQPPGVSSNLSAAGGLADQPNRISLPAAGASVPDFKTHSAPDTTVLSVAAPAAPANARPDAGTKFADAKAHLLANLTEPPPREAKTSVGPALEAPTAAATSETTSQPFSPSVVALLIARGDALLETGDIAAARLMYERAAWSNSGQAAIAMGMTYDSRFLAQIGARGIAAEPQRAIVWYQHAAALGRPEGTQLVASLRAGDGN